MRYSAIVIVALSVLVLVNMEINHLRLTVTEDETQIETAQSESQCHHFPISYLSILILQIVNTPNLATEIVRRSLQGVLTRKNSGKIHKANVLKNKKIRKFYRSTEYNRPSNGHDSS
jgi:hypothetical protein